MAKILPFNIFKKNTDLLDPKFNTDTGRYDICGNAKPENSFDLWMKRVEKVTKCDTTGWMNQCDVFKILINDLKSIDPKKDGEKGSLILIGALLHRYFRMITYYENTGAEPISIVTSLFYKPRTPLNSKFFQAIRIALQLEAKVKYNDFQAKDLAKLDVVTIVDSLTYFHDYMVSEDENSQPQHEKYAHFKHSNDPYFVTNLEDIIEQYSAVEGAHQMLMQYKAIRFIKSLAKQLDSDNEVLDKALAVWVKALNKDYPDFSQLNTMLLEKHLNEHTKSELLRQKIKMLFLYDDIKSQINCLSDSSDVDLQDKKAPSCLNHALFLEQMKTLNLTFASFNLYGGYSILLQSSAISDNLKFFMLQALGDVNGSLNNTNEDMVSGIESLCEYIKSDPEIKLDWSFFGSKKGFNTQLSNIIVSLSVQIKKNTQLKQEEEVEEVEKLGLSLI